MGASVLSRALALQSGCQLPQAWSEQACWRILDIAFEPLRFLLNWQTWRAHEHRPRLLHYVALSHTTPEPEQLVRVPASMPELQALADELREQCIGLMPGFHRLTLDRGHVLLTLCIGESRNLLREEQFSADSLYLDASAITTSWDRWDFKALARCCRRGTSIGCTGATPALLQGLTHSGFEMTDTAGQYAPRWTIKTSRDRLRLNAAEVGNCVIVGAGLAGASVAATLARRGWQVKVLDAAPEPAQGASGLPAGLVVPHVSADDSPRSRLSRSGVRLTLQQASALLQTGDWQLSGVLEKGLGLKPDHWHAQAGWIKPAHLVRAWLALPGITFQGNTRVASLKKIGENWELLDDAGHVLASARHVVLANALSLPSLLEPLRQDAELGNRLGHLPAVHGMQGALTWGLRTPSDEAVFPQHPVNGLGSLIPAVPSAQGTAWYAGATYESADLPPAPTDAQHQANLDKLQQLLPEVARVAHSAQRSGQLQLWRGTRCISADRMPLAGPLESGEVPGLWISAAMGSRGLSFAVLCAELLAARIGAEPWPVEASLARFLDPWRKQVN